MIKNLYLFTWEEKYLLDKELNRRTSTFSDKYWKDSITVFSSENRDEWSINQSIFWWWLFSSKKLIILRWLPLSAEKQNGFNSEEIEKLTDQILNKWENIPSDNLIVFVSYNPDKRWRLYKFLQKNWNLKEFSKINSIELKKFIQNQLSNFKISEKTISFFIEKVWEELYHIDSELDKLINYCGINNIETIDENIINKVCFGQNETVAFQFLDKLFNNKNDAIDYLDKIKDWWTNWNEFAWALYYQIKTDIILDQYNKAGIKWAKEISEDSGIPQWAIFANMKNIKQISKNWNELKNMYKVLISSDIWIKTWKIQEDTFRLNIKKAGIMFNN